MTALHEFIERKSKELANAQERFLKLESPLNHRQEALVSKALNEPHARFTIAGHQNSHRIAYGTARSDLMDLEERQLFFSKKQSKSYYFYPAKNLADILKGMAP